MISEYFGLARLVAAVGLAGIVVATLGYVAYNRFLHPLRHVKGPFLATVTPWVQLYHGINGDRHLWLHNLHQKYGSHVRVAPNFVSINTAKGLRDIYGHGKQFKKADFYHGFAAIKGVYNTHNAIDKTIHGKKRRVLSHAFSDQALKAMEDVMLIHIRQLCAVLGEEPRYMSDVILPNEYKTEKGQIVRNMSNWLGFMTYDVLGELCFGKSFNLLTDGAKRNMVHLVDRAAYRHYVCGLWMPLDRWGLDKIFIRKLTMDRWNFIMKSRAEATERAKERVEAGHDSKKDFFYYLLNAKDPETGEGLSMKELWGEANVLMVAGSDTTSTSIVATLFYLVRHTKVMEKLKEEVRSSFTDVEQIVSGPQLNDLAYLKACIDEAMRLSPAVPGSIPREAMEGGAEVDGVFLPAGSECGTPAFSIHRSPDYYREPLQYIPERWIEGATCQTRSGRQSWVVTRSEIEVARNAFCPFSIGPRGCIGKSMALMEMRITLARLLFLFDIELADRTGEDADGFLALTDHFVSAKTGPNVLIRRRQDLTQGLSAHHPRPFFALFRHVDDWLRRYFTGVYQLIDAEDMRMFIDRSSNFGRTSNLRTLFYPVWPDDFNITMRVRVTGDLHRLNVASLKDAHRQGTDPGFPDLERPVTIDGTTYYKRRPDFLSRLTDALYHHLFTRLKSLDEDAAFPNWSKVMKDDTQHTSQVFSSVMKHMMLELPCTVTAKSSSSSSSWKIRLNAIGTSQRANQIDRHAEAKLPAKD